MWYRRRWQLEWRLTTPRNVFSALFPKRLVNVELRCIIAAHACRYICRGNRQKSHWNRGPSRSLIAVGWKNVSLQGFSSGFSCLALCMQ